jgi:hypothetical protein
MRVRNYQPSHRLEGLCARERLGDCGEGRILISLTTVSFFVSSLPLSLSSSCPKFCLRLWLDHTPNHLKSSLALIPILSHFFKTDKIMLSNIWPPNLKTTKAYHSLRLNISESGVNQGSKVIRQPLSQMFPLMPKGKRILCFFCFVSFFIF